MAKAWYDYSALSAALSLANDDLLARDKSDITDNATHGTVLRLPIDGLLGLSGITPGGRLTLESGVPVSTSNQTSKSTLYYTPFVHDFVRLYDGTRPKLFQFPEFSLSLTLTNGKNYDAFIYDNSGSPALELSSAWTDDTTRANALAWQAGVGWVKSGSPTRLWVGTIRASGTNTCEQSFATTDAPAKQFVWNAYNRVRVGCYVHDSTDTWTYTTATWRQKRGSANNQIEWVCGLAGELVDLRNSVRCYNTSSAVGMFASIGIDSTSAISSVATVAEAYNSAAGTVVVPLVANCPHNSALGYHYAAALEQSDATGTTTWGGDVGNNARYKTALIGSLSC